MISMPSPFGGGEQDPKMIVIHVMGEFIDDAGDHYYAPFWLEHLRLSAHKLVTPSGCTIRTRDDTQIAYHAKGNNVDSLGLEILCPGLHNYDTLQQATKHDYMPPEQYVEVVEQVRDWMREWGIEKVVRHCDLDPDRRWFDPGDGFPWDQFLEDIR